MLVSFRFKKITTIDIAPVNADCATKVSSKNKPALRNVALSAGIRKKDETIQKINTASHFTPIEKTAEALLVCKFSGKIKNMKNGR